MAAGVFNLNFGSSGEGFCGERCHSPRYFGSITSIGGNDIFMCGVLLCFKN